MQTQANNADSRHWQAIYNGYVDTIKNAQKEDWTNAPTSMHAKKCDRFRGCPGIEPGTSRMIRLKQPKARIIPLDQQPCCVLCDIGVDIMAMHGLSIGGSKALVMCATLRIDVQDGGLVWCCTAWVGVLSLV